MGDPAVEVHGEDVRLVRGGFMVQMWRMTGGSIRTRRSWGGNWKRLTSREILMLRDDVRQALLREPEREAPKEGQDGQ
jgi:hypothetical protein